MRYIAHRGNLFGSNPKWENTPNYIQYALDSGYDVEIDIQLRSGRFYLGHDKILDEIPFDFLVKNGDKLWCHAKTVQTLQALLNFPEINCFYHDKDLYTLTSKNDIWTLVELTDVDDCIALCFNHETFISRYKNNKYRNILGICSDEIIPIQKYLEKQK